jgi:hypothetical protein
VKRKKATVPVSTVHDAVLIEQIFDSATTCCHIMGKGRDINAGGKQFDAANGAMLAHLDLSPLLPPSFSSHI